MPYLTTGLINNSAAASEKRAMRLLVEITNNDRFNVAVQIDGFVQQGNQEVKYVDEFFTLSPGTVDTRSYYSFYDIFEFQFFVSSQDIAIFVWGTDITGNRTVAYPIMVLGNLLDEYELGQICNTSCTSDVE